jgi:septum formation protein
MTVPEIVLASNSPRRKDILGWTGLHFTTHAADIDETPKPGEPPLDYVQRLADTKARACANFAPFNGLVLSADTIVVDDEEIMGKPKDPADARRMLRQLRGRMHQVHTAIVLMIPSKGISYTNTCSTPVHMRRYSDEELEAYLETADPLDKAGAYAIQHPQFRPVVKFAGCYASVMGLPLCHVERTLRKMGFGEHREIPFQCQNALSYACPIFKLVLNGEEVG